MNKQEAKSKIANLIQEYESLKQKGQLADKNEEFTKQRFIRPFFEALGWDFLQDVWPEEKVSKGRVDYAFKISQINKLFVEAKKFSVDLEEEQWAEQIIEYAWNRSVTWGVLTDFEVDIAFKGFSTKVNQVFQGIKEHRNPHRHKGLKFVDPDLVEAESYELLIEQEKIRELLKPDAIPKLEKRIIESFNKSKNRWIKNAKSNDVQISGFVEELFSRLGHYVYQLLEVEPLSNIRNPESDKPQPPEPPAL